MILLAGWMLLIFMLSAQPGHDSAETSSLVAGFIYEIYSALLAHAAHLDERTFMQLYLQPIRKLAHFTEFCVLGVLIYINVAAYRKERVFLYSLAFSILYAISDEIHQLFVINRYCSLEDIGVDTAGALCGIFICHLVYSGWKKRH